jgi:hypothetical protein
VLHRATAHRPRPPAPRASPMESSLALCSLIRTARSWNMDATSLMLRTSSSMSRARLMASTYAAFASLEASFSIASCRKCAGSAVAACAYATPRRVTGVGGGGAGGGRGGGRRTSRISASVFLPAYTIIPRRTRLSCCVVLQRGVGGGGGVGRG